MGLSLQHLIGKKPLELFQDKTESTTLRSAGALVCFLFFLLTSGTAGAKIANSNALQCHTPAG